MEIIGFTGLQLVFGGTKAYWKGQIDRGLPVMVEPGLHSGQPRVYDSLAVHAWLLDQVLFSSKDGKSDYATERTRLTKAQADNLETDLAVKQKNLLPAELVEKIWSGMTTAARAHLLGLPTRIAAECALQDFAIIESRAQEIVYEALLELHAYDPEAYA